VNEDQATSGVGAAETGLAGPRPAGMAPAGTAPAGTALVGAGSSGAKAADVGRRLSQSPTTRMIGTLGVAALVVVGSILGAALLRNSSGAARGSGNIRIVLASTQASAAAAGAQITVTGSGQVEGTPDTATFSIGVDTTASSAVAALEQNNSQVSTLEHSLEQSGVATKDIQTSWLDLYTNTNNNGDVTGFSADDELNVTMHNLSYLGQALDAAVHATGNGVTLGGISFSISNQSALLAAARAQAMLSARTEADQLAAGAGLTLGSIVKVTDQENANQYLTFGDALAPAAAGRVPVQAGQQQISVQVTVVYQLKS